MDKTIELVNLWAAFYGQFPQASIEDFCRHRLAHEKAEAKKAHLPAGGFLPTTIDGNLMRQIGRIFKLHSFYSSIALSETELKSIEEFSLLNIIYHLKEPRKTEAIFTGLYELSTGIDMLKRLKKLGYLSEYADSEDKRSKRLKVTPLGEKVLTASKERVMKLAEMMFFDLSDDHKLLCFQLLKSVEEKFAGNLQIHKNKKFEDIYTEMMMLPNTKKKV
jgi:DNA-binding MarR family transcriptional regulator